VNVHNKDGQWHLEAFLAASADDPDPLRISLVGSGCDEVTEQAWNEIQKSKGNRS
jgi:hypothetical protein